MTNEIARLLSALTALGCAVFGAIVAWHYPIYPALAVSLFVLWAVCCFRWPSVWIPVIPTLLPVTGFATWTGWFAFEELDLLVLERPRALRCDGASRSIHRNRRAARTAFLAADPDHAGGICCVVAVAIYRGVADAGGFEFDWIGDYHSPMNSLRLGKSYVMALLLWPLLRNALRANERRTLDRLGAGLALGLGAASIAVLAERAAFTDLLNFSSDYRTTGLFWEMHVGGAALDGFLALTFPFIVWKLHRKGGPVRLGFVLLLMAAATYACFTTFSRGVYLAIPAGIATLTLMLLMRRPVVPWAFYGRMTAFAAIAICAMYLVFRHGGYRSLAAFLATVAVGLALDQSVRGARFSTSSMALITGLMLGAIVVVVTVPIHKAPYVAFALAFAWNAALSFRAPSVSSRSGVFMRLVAFGVLVAAAAGIALYWGGEAAFVDNLVALAFAAAFTMVNALLATPWIPTDLRSRSISFGALCVLAATVAVFGGGAYMGERLGEASNDLELRTSHWKDGVAMLSTAEDWWLGKGLGRFPANYFFMPLPTARSPAASRCTGATAADTSSWPGRVIRQAGATFSSRTADHSIPRHLYGGARGAQPAAITDLHIELCEQQLLYNGECGAAGVKVLPRPDWQRISVVLDGSRLSSGTWYAPRFGFFALAVASSGQALDIRDVSLISPAGRNLIVNRDFNEGMAHWIPISERYHLPWHIKNMELNVCVRPGHRRPDDFSASSRYGALAACIRHGTRSPGGAVSGGIAGRLHRGRRLRQPAGRSASRISVLLVAVDQSRAAGSGRRRLAPAPGLPTRREGPNEA